MIWKDRIKQYAHRYTLTNVSGTTYDFAEVTGEVNEVGTPVNAENMNKLLQRDGDDIKDTVTTFTEAGTRANIATGENTSTIFGKIKKWFTDLKPHAFNDLATALGAETDKAPTNKLLNDTAALKIDKTDISTTAPISSAAASNEKVYSEKLAFDQLAFKAGLADANIFTGANKFDRTINGVTNELSLNESAWDIFVCRDTANPTRKTAIAKGYVWCQESDNIYGRFHSQNIYYGNDTVGYEGTLKFPAANIGEKYLAVTDNADGTLDSLYDVIIRTQAQFNAMIADPTWFDAVSVAFVGQFTLSTANNSGVKRPANVTRIDGYNNAKITVTNFKHNPTTAKGGLWDDENTNNPRCYINDLSVNCTGVGMGNSYGFYGSNNTYTNCTGTGTGYSYSFGFSGNNNTYTNCTGTGTGTGTGSVYGFNGNNNTYTNCTGTGTGTNGYGTGFSGNNNTYTNCTGTGTGANGYGFNGCNNLSNCKGKGTGTYGYGFYNINYAVNCKDGGSTTAMWGGTNSNIVIDDSSAQTISGVKTFSVSPLVPTTPSGASAAVAKAYVDSLRTVYDKVIRTQAEFDALIASATWLGATSVAFVGQFTLSTANNSGVKIPATVKQIHGFNSAKITITNFKYDAYTGKGGLWYDTTPTTLDYSIRDLEVSCTGTKGNGFTNCNNLSNCTGTGTGTSYGNGFIDCNNLSNCIGTGTGTVENGYGFSGCNNLSNCTGTGRGISGYGFSYINYAVNCKDGGSSTNMWADTNKNIALDTCRKTLVTADNSALNT